MCKLLQQLLLLLITALCAAEAKSGSTPSSWLQQLSDSSAAQELLLIHLSGCSGPDCLSSEGCCSSEPPVNSTLGHKAMQERSKWIAHGGFARPGCKRLFGTGPWVQG